MQRRVRAALARHASQQEAPVGQVNVNTPGGGTNGTSDGSGYGFIVGILVAIVVIALLVYFFVLNPGNGGGNTTNNGGTDNTETDGDTQPSGWRLVNIA
jgi:peptidoglycan/LPS O-acetylase OafA/YrhL